MSFNTRIHRPGLPISLQFPGQISNIYTESCEQYGYISQYFSDPSWPILGKLASLPTQVAKLISSLKKLFTSINKFTLD